jgi:hypothetical protein
MAHAHASDGFLVFSHRRPGLRHELQAGGRAGVAAGVAMAVALMAISSMVLRRNAFYPLEVIGASVAGASTGLGLPGSGGVRDVVCGALVHLLAMSLSWGVVFGLVVWISRPERGVALAWLGLLLGAAAQVIDVNLLIPYLSRSTALAQIVPVHVVDIWSERIPLGVSWMAHLVFGLGLSVYPWRYDPATRTFD